jgi:uncharacterized protein (TIGR03435 family)
MLRTLSIALLAGAAFAQTPAVPPAFEVASVKVNTSGDRPSEKSDDGRMTMTAMPLRVVIAAAYQIPWIRVDGPSWLDSQCVDIAAKIPPDATRETFFQMIQTLLADRFALKVHREQKPVAVYAIVMSNQKPTLKPSAPNAQQKTTWTRGEGNQITFHNTKMTMAELAEAMPHWMSQNWFDLPVADLTGLDQAYDFDLTFVMTNRAPAETEASDPTGDTIFDAIRKQLGLKVEKRKAPIERIVVDHMERVPTEN